jgi:TonB family protein
LYLVGGHELVYHELPHYPEVAVFHRWEGSGIARLHVRSDGTVSDVKFLKSTGYQRLDIAAREAFSRWRFRPEKAPFTADVPCDFRLGDKGRTRAIITPVTPKA